MPNTCSVPNCKSGYASNPIKRRMFFPPKDANLFRQWEKMIPKQGPLKRKHSVCELHFEEADIIKGKTFIINGKEDFFPMQWKLKQGAIPRIFPGCPSYLSKPSKHRKPPKDRSQLIPLKSKKSDSHQPIPENITDAENSFEEDAKISHTTAIEINLNTVRLPSLAWSWVLNDCVRNTFSDKNTISCCETVRAADGKILSRRSIDVNLISGIVSYFLFGVALSSLPASFKTKLCTQDDLSDLLQCFNDANVSVCE